MCSILNLITKTHPENLLCQLSRYIATLNILNFQSRGKNNSVWLNKFLRSYCIHGDATSTFRLVTMRNTVDWVGGEHTVLPCYSKLNPETYYPHVMLRVQLGYLTLNSGRHSHFCHSAYVTSHEMCAPTEI
jgi:hypothetical protein